MMPADGAGNREPLITLSGITKSFGPVLANDDVHLSIDGGEVLALVGENGAGKSTLMRLLFGVDQPDRGEIRIDGERVNLASPRAAMAHQIGMVFQRFSLVPAMTVLENLLVAWPQAPWWQLRSAKRVKRVLQWIGRLAPQLDPRRRVADLSVGERQIVELAKVLNLEPRIVILDEPTSVLVPAEAERLYRFVREIADEGKAVVLITHKIADVLACADRIAVMRSGRMVDVAPLATRTADAVVAAMVGDGAPSALSPPAAPLKPVPRLQLVRVSTDPSGAGRSVSGIDLEIAAGEILGIAGVAGNGQSALAGAVAGLVPVVQGYITLDGVSIARRPRAPPVIEPAVAYIPEQPIENAVVASLDLATNLDLRKLGSRASSFFLRRRDSIRRARGLITGFDVRPPRPELTAAALSGGNLQKLVIARELSGAPRLVVACYPTMGLDLNASRAVYQQMFAQAARGAAFLWLSEDLDDLLAFAHRIAVIANGRLAGIVAREQATRELLGRWMIGAADAA